VIYYKTSTIHFTENNNNNPLVKTVIKEVD
jgi:hypothetical protein